MNATPAPDGRSETPDEPADPGAPGAPVPLADAVPHQKRRTPGAGRPGEPDADPLEAPDPHLAAQAAAVENLL
ncbi:iron transporter, partial [Streptomyces sp. SID4982]|nr:iron transporter [Streptomyces sp. SID4982]